MNYEMTQFLLTGIERRDGVLCFVLIIMRKPKNLAVIVISGSDSALCSPLDKINIKERNLKKKKKNCYKLYK